MPQTGRGLKQRYPHKKKSICFAPLRRVGHKMQEREKVRPGEGLKVGRVEVVVPATVDEEVEAINGDQIRERVLIVHSTQWHYSH